MEVTKQQEGLLKKIEQLKLTDEEAIRLLQQLKKPEVVRKNYDHFYNSKRIKIGVISDTHIGSKYFDYNAFDESVKTFNKEKVEAIYHAGDVIEGMSNRQGHIYELSHIGTSAQINHAVELLNQYKQPLFFTTGNHDEWSKVKADQGVLVGEILEDKIKNSTFLGEYTADIKLTPTTKMRLTHEGANAYALSYSLQKRINGLAGGDKPDILLNGHIHKYIYMFYRNIHSMECGTFQKQTPFMAMKGSPAMVAYSVLDISFNKKGVNNFVLKSYPHY
jgi:DNA polymerase II small subunit/DNA polymerase delta subunit B